MHEPPNKMSRTRMSISESLVWTFIVEYPFKKYRNERCLGRHLTLELLRDFFEIK